MTKQCSYCGKTYANLRQLIVDNMALGLNYDLVNRRISNGWLVNDALSLPKGSKNPSPNHLYRVFGKDYHSFKELIEDNKDKTMSYRGVRSRLHKGWSLKDALETPLISNRRKGRQKGKSDQK